MMKKEHRNGWLIAGIGFALMAGATSQASAAATPSGNMNLSLDGYAVITPNSGTPETADIEGIGQVTADTTGAFTGALTYTAVSAALVRRMFALAQSPERSPRRPVASLHVAEILRLA
jgi:hypothetical protein